MRLDRWLDQQRTTACADAAELCARCCSILTEETKVPLNVSCSNVLRGLFVRTDTKFEAKGSAWGSTPFKTNPHGVRMPQIDSLRAALQLAQFKLQSGSISEALEALDRAEHVCEVPPHSVRFPAARIPLNTNILGVCGEAFVCERKNIVFNVHRYQDVSQEKFVATETLSSKETDPKLQTVWELIDEARIKLRNALTLVPS